MISNFYVFSVFNFRYHSNDKLPTDRRNHKNSATHVVAFDLKISSCGFMMRSLADTVVFVKRLLACTVRICCIFKIFLLAFSVNLSPA